MKYHRLTVLRDGPNKNGRTTWICRCDCGNEFTPLRDSVRRGLTKSCGCLQAENRTKAATHGAYKNHSETGTHRSWRMMMARCYSTSNNRYALYGGRGITVTKRWHSFPHFLKDMGERPVGLTIGRRDTNKNYCKSNCQWESQASQQNNRRNNNRITIDGIEKTVAEWAKASGTPAYLIYSRLSIGFKPKRAVFAALRGKVPEPQKLSRYAAELVGAQ